MFIITKIWGKTNNRSPGSTACLVSSCRHGYRSPCHCVYFSQYHLAISQCAALSSFKIGLLTMQACSLTRWSLTNYFWRCVDSRSSVFSQDFIFSLNGSTKVVKQSLTTSRMYFYCLSLRSIVHVKLLRQFHFFALQVSRMSCWLLISENNSRFKNWPYHFCIESKNNLIS